MSWTLNNMLAVEMPGEGVQIVVDCRFDGTEPPQLGKGGLKKHFSDGRVLDVELLMELLMSKSPPPKESGCEPRSMRTTHWRH